MKKRILIGTIVMFVILELGSYIIHQKLLMSSYQSIQGLWRPDADMRSKLYVFVIIYAVVAFFFTFIFSRGYESRGIMEGIRYGAVMGVFTQLPEAYSQYVVYPIPYDLIRNWFVYGFIEYVIMGAVLSLIFSRVR